MPSSMRMPATPLRMYSRTILATWVGPPKPTSTSMTMGMETALAKVRPSMMEVVMSISPVPWMSSMGAMVASPPMKRYSKPARSRSLAPKGVGALMPKMGLPLRKNASRTTVEAFLLVVIAYSYRVLGLAPDYSTGRGAGTPWAPPAYGGGPPSVPLRFPSGRTDGLRANGRGALPLRLFLPSYRLFLPSYRRRPVSRKPGPATGCPL